MKKYILLSLMIAIVPNYVFGASARYNQLVAEKQRKIEELEKCSGNINAWKIAGISTIGLTAVGVAGNIALANTSKDYDTKIEKVEGKIATTQENISKLEEQKRLAEAERIAREACERANGTYNNGVCTCNDTTKVYRNGNCVDVQSTVVVNPVKNPNGGNNSVNNGSVTNGAAGGDTPTVVVNPVKNPNGENNSVNNGNNGNATNGAAGGDAPTVVENPVKNPNGENNSVNNGNNGNATNGAAGGDTPTVVENPVKNPNGENNSVNKGNNGSKKSEKNSGNKPVSGCKYGDTVYKAGDTITGKGKDTPFNTVSVCTEDGVKQCKCTCVNKNWACEVDACVDDYYDLKQDNSVTDAYHPFRCVKLPPKKENINNVFNNTQVNLTQGKILVEEWARLKNIGQIKCDNTYTSQGNDDILKCTAGNTEYSILFDDLNEQMARTAHQSIAKTICELYGGKKVVETNTGISAAIRCDLPTSVNCGNLNTSLKRFSGFKAGYESVYNTSNVGGYHQSLAYTYCKISW